MPLSDRQREIIDAALGLISELGIQELTMKRISAEVGISEPALYRHFTSKSDILSAVVDEMEAVRVRVLAEARSPIQDASLRIPAFFEAHARHFSERPALATVLFSEDIFRNNEALHKRVAGMVAGTQELLRKEIEQGRLALEFRQNVDPDTAALMLAGGFRLLVSAWSLCDRNFDLVVRTRGFIDSVLRLLRA